MTGPRAKRTEREPTTGGTAKVEAVDALLVKARAQASATCLSCMRSGMAAAPDVRDLLAVLDEARRELSGK